MAKSIQALCNKETKPLLHCLHYLKDTAVKPQSSEDERIHLRLIIENLQWSEQLSSKTNQFRQKEYTISVFNVDNWRPNSEHIFGLRG